MVPRGVGVVGVGVEGVATMSISGWLCQDEKNPKNTSLTVSEFLCCHESEMSPG